MRLIASAETSASESMSQIRLPHKTVVSGVSPHSCIGPVGAEIPCVTSESGICVSCPAFSSSDMDCSS